MTRSTDDRHRRRVTINTDNARAVSRTQPANAGPCGVTITTGPTFNPQPAVELTVYPDGTYEVHERTRAGLTNLVTTGSIAP